MNEWMNEWMNEYLTTDRNSSAICCESKVNKRRVW